MYASVCMGMPTGIPFSPLSLPVLRCLVSQSCPTFAIPKYCSQPAPQFK